MTIFPIAITQIDWTNYVIQVSNLIIRSPTRSLDSANIPVGTAESFLASLAEFEKKDTNPIEFLKNNSIIFKHFNISYLCETNEQEFLNIIPMTPHGLIFTINDNLSWDNDYRFIVTGSIYTWREIIILYMKERFNPLLREFLYKIYLGLEKKEFKIMFSDYRSVKLIDGSYILERKA